MCRVSWTRMRGTPALRHRTSKDRLKLRGSIDVPFLVVKTRLEFFHFAPAALRASSWVRRRCLSAVMHRSSSGSDAVESSVGGSAGEKEPRELTGHGAGADRQHHNLPEQLNDYLLMKRSGRHELPGVLASAVCPGDSLEV